LNLIKLFFSKDFCMKFLYLLEALKEQISS